MTDEHAEFVQAELWKVANAARREVGEEIAAAFDREVELIESLPDDEGVRPQVRDILRARRAAFRDSARIARDIATKETP